jgi:hypothetical protein
VTIDHRNIASLVAGGGRGPWSDGGSSSTTRTRREWTMLRRIRNAAYCTVSVGPAGSGLDGPDGYQVTLHDRA